MVLFSHPADFTPVCTNEFMLFKPGYPEFQKRGRALGTQCGLRILSHAWTSYIQKNRSNVHFPIIADLSKEVSIKYGMISPRRKQTETIGACLSLT
jgi:peroxiredoxin (alkyl hydroperoxide reductase subunit C)